MKALGGPFGTRDTDTCFLTRPYELMLLCSLVLILILLPLAAGCSIVENLPVSSPSTTLGVTAGTTPAPTATTQALAKATTTTVAAQTTTTTVAEETTTTLSVTTTTTEESALAPLTTTTTTAVTGGQATGGPGTVLYEITNWSNGTSGWAAAGQWKAVGGMLVTDGSSSSFAIAPVDLTGHPDYAVEAEIQILKPKAETDVLLMARMINGIGFWGGVDGSAKTMVVGYDQETLGDCPFILDSDWHKYRLEVRGNTMKLFFEQAEVARAVDNRALEPGTVGIYCGNGQINVRSFRVTALE